MVSPDIIELLPTKLEEFLSNRSSLDEFRQWVFDAALNLPMFFYTQIEDSWFVCFMEALNEPVAWESPLNIAEELRETASRIVKALDGTHPWDDYLHIQGKLFSGRRAVPDSVASEVLRFARYTVPDPNGEYRCELDYRILGRKTEIVNVSVFKVD